MDPPAPFHPSATRRPTRPTVRVGVGVVVAVPLNRSSSGDNNQEEWGLWAGVRKSSHGEGLLALPGGHLEMYESWENCAIREVLEETSMRITTPQFVHCTNDMMQNEGKHYITIFMMSKQIDPNQKAENCEPEKCEGWNVYSWQDLRNLLASPGEEEETAEQEQHPNATPDENANSQNHHPTTEDSNEDTIMKPDSMPMETTSTEAAAAATVAIVTTSTSRDAPDSTELAAAAASIKPGEKQVPNPATGGSSKDAPESRTTMMTMNTSDSSLSLSSSPPPPRRNKQPRRIRLFGPLEQLVRQQPPALLDFLGVTPSPITTTTA